MIEGKPHIPVMLSEVIKFLSPEDNKIYVDCTFGAGGYSKAILEEADCKLYAIDRDDTVIPYAKELEEVYEGKFTFIQGRFSDLERLLAKYNVNKVDGIVLDIGVSSMQVDQGERGFSFMNDGILDMRMDRKHSVSAAEVVNNYSEQELANIIYKFGEERSSRKIARAIVTSRTQQPISSTIELANIIRRVLPKKHFDKIDPATKTFQALRIYVNNELEELNKVLELSERLLKEKGRLVVVSFHGLEDKIVKSFLKEKSGKIAKTSRYMYLTDENKTQVKTFELLENNAIKPTEKEINLNPRARSARLRAAIKL